MLRRMDELRKGFREFPERVEPPETFVAALRSGIAKRSVGKVDGLLLNFCSPRYAACVIERLDAQAVEDTEFACYLKIFYSSESDETARRLMLREFLSYDSAPQYHEVFVQDVTADSILGLKKSDDWKSGHVELPQALQTVVLPML